MPAADTPSDPRSVAPPQLCHWVERHLDDHLALFEHVASLLQSLDLREGGTADPFVSVSQQAARLREDRRRLSEQLQPHCAAAPVRLSQLCTNPTDRERIDRRCRDVRTAAARVLGLLRGTAAAVAVWGDVLQSAAEAMLGATPKETTYTDRGSLAADQPAT